MPTKLGQNFLINEGIAKKIAESADINGENVLEVGPGKGILTKYLIKHARKIIAIEIDPALSKLLDSRFPASPAGGRGNGNFKVFTNDMLKTNLPDLLEKENFKNYKVVANLPYYITSKIIRLFLETRFPPEEMILMVQKEVGERIVALDGKESILSISVKFYAEPEVFFYVPKENFEPVPEVDSAVIRVKKKKNPPKADAGKFFSLVRAGFSSKRKTLLNNLSNGFHQPKEKITENIKKAGLDPAVRAEKLGLKEWMRLYEEVVGK